MSDLKFSIRSATPDDAKGFSALMGDEGVFPGTLQLPYPTNAAWAERLTAKPKDGDIQLVADTGGEVIGSIGLFGEPRMRRRHACGLGIGVIGHAQGKGVGSALMRAVTDYADQWTTYLRIELTVFSDNAHAIALYKKFGFEPEGVMRQYALKNGRLHDAVFMARLRPSST